MPKTTAVCETLFVNAAQSKRVQQWMPSEALIYQATEIFATLSDPTRARIVFALSETELCVHDLTALLNMQMSAVSHQLRLLRQMGLIKYRKAGRHAYYSLDDEHAAQILAQVLEHVKHIQPSRQVARRHV